MGGEKDGNRKGVSIIIMEEEWRNWKGFHWTQQTLTPNIRSKHNGVGKEIVGDWGGIKKRNSLVVPTIPEYPYQGEE